MGHKGPIKTWASQDATIFRVFQSLFYKLKQVAKGNTEKAEQVY